MSRFVKWLIETQNREVSIGIRYDAESRTMLIGTKTRNEDELLEVMDLIEVTARKPRYTTTGKVQYTNIPCSSGILRNIQKQLEESGYIVKKVTSLGKVIG